MSKLTRKIHENIRNCPDYTVLCDGAGSFTFSQLDSYARKIASRLINSGVVKNDFVTIYGKDVKYQKNN